MIEDIKDIERQAMQKVFRHLPIQMGILLFLNFLDRVNIGFAAPHMMKDLGLTASVFGFASGIFFAGYFLFEVPSNLMLQKIGARPGRSVETPPLMVAQIPPPCAAGLMVLFSWFSISAQAFQRLP